MSIIHILTLFVVFLFLPLSAQAESPFTGGMKYTAVRKANNAAPQKTNSALIQQKTISKTTAAEPETEETPASKVWKKYKALAAGQIEETPAAQEPATMQGSALPSAPTQEPAEAAPTIAPTGIASILQKYHENKEQRSQIRTIRAPKAAKPDLPTKPQVAAPAKAQTE